MAEAEHHEVPMNADRVCDAIARIGYSAHSALMDIIDNSVMAGAKKVVVELVQDEDKNHTNPNNVRAYRVIDDGCGMSDAEILKALKLGADEDYPPDSLSKYGMGLKAAGFSLGTRIEVISKKDGELSSFNYLDREVIAEAKKYVVCREELRGEQGKEFAGRLGNGPSGTVVEITGTGEIDHPSARATRENLIKQLGVTYYEFLKDEEKPFKIIVSCTGKGDVVVEPLDILFLSEADGEFDPDSFDCKRPCKVYDGEVELDVGPSLQLEVVVFPQDKMKNYAGFSKGEQDRIKNFRVNRNHKGFFIYRNKRLIRWADDLYGMIGKDDINLRARVSLTTEHDDTLKVDVSKQRLDIPEAARLALNAVMIQPKKDAEKAMELCGNLRKHPGEEGEGFNERNKDLFDEDPDPPEAEAKVEEQKKRRKANVEWTQEKLAEAGEAEEDTSGEDTTPRKIRYSDKIKGLRLWEAGRNSDGVFIRINKNHNFYHTILAKLEEGSGERQSIEGLLWVLAVAELRTQESLADSDKEAIDKVLAKYADLFGYNLDKWCSTNYDLLENV